MPKKLKPCPFCGGKVKKNIGSIRATVMFVGRTGIFDHDPKGANHTARIYSAEVVRDNSRKTRSGEAYVCIKAKAYMMRTEKNLPFIAEIEGGIKKEVSVSCSISREICSICGADRNHSACSHIKGQYYSGKLCEGILDEPTDAYEWSFVAIPAQVTGKRYIDAKKYIDAESVKSAVKEVCGKYNIAFDNGHGGFGDMLAETIENMPATYVQEVVRCKDCKMYTDNIDDPNLRKGFCDRIAWQCYDRRNPDDFCNYGVRKRG